MDDMARLDPKPVEGSRWLASFITLTYPYLPEIPRTKADLRAFAERIRRRFPGVSWYWREEFDSSGARDYNPHFHLIVFGLPWVDREWLDRIWAEVVGRPVAYTRIRGVRSLRQLMAYVSKYAAKSGGGLVLSSYPHAHVDEETGEVVGEVGPGGRIPTGRVWGKHNAACLPYGDLVQVSMVCGRWFFDVKRGARIVWEGVNGRRWAGFSLFCGDPVRWLELALFYAEGEVRQ